MADKLVIGDRVGLKVRYREAQAWYRHLCVGKRFNNTGVFVMDWRSLKVRMNVANELKS